MRWLFLTLRAFQTDFQAPSARVKISTSLLAPPVAMAERSAVATRVLMAPGTEAMRCVPVSRSTRIMAPVEVAP